MSSPMVQFSASIWSIMKCRHGQFIGSYHAIGQRLRPPQNFSSVEARWSPSKSGAHWIVLVISPSSELRIAHHFFLLDSLFFGGYSVKIWEFFSIGLISLSLAFLAYWAHLDAPDPFVTLLGHLTHFFDHLDTSLV